MTEFRFEEGEILLFDKPFDWSSFDVVKKVRYTIRRTLGKDLKVGHAGTLDPYATGLLILCTGKFTRKIESIQGLEKEYEGTIRLGATTPSYDMETEPDQEFPTSHITEEMLLNAVAAFRGEIDQVPPVFSAKMVGGKRAYEFARKGKPLELQPSRVTVYDFTVLGFSGDSVDFRIRCSKGTYIRSLAHDLGKALGSGGYLSRLVRTAIGPYRLENAMSPEEFTARLSGE